MEGRLDRWLVPLMFAVGERPAIVLEPVTIRQATIEDIPFLRAMIREALLASPRFLASQGERAIAQAEATRWTRWREHPEPAFVAEDATLRKVGAITLRPHTASNEQGWQIGIGVEGSARGQGVGYRLVERAILYAIQTRSAYLNLLVDPSNLPAIALYRRVGFRDVGESEHLLEMRLPLES
jgi:ribosomal protein S18 acetylase RimI-like enzyme